MGSNRNPRREPGAARGLPPGAGCADHDEAAPARGRNGARAPRQPTHGPRRFARTAGFDYR
ncbi:hypothetical protein A8H31_06595 [Burkholderia thailandensis]|nr:hypothetical protein WJ27_18680 [Burkholderia thailandensis]AVR07205.1 hypothetical protein A8H31_06595 [Burkholderia thailandensis]NOK41294.1 hypothetical protein [Burkholderia thailandensis]NOK51661.1 hypothetical protein [Burkholderia thailandensis]PHH35021.1 hypothetical protein CRX59_31565 [Burkholderia thailandensis]